MSRKIKKQYGAFSREILAEFIKEKELIELDKKYSLAKLNRFVKRIKKQTGLEDVWVVVIYDSDNPDKEEVIYQTDNKRDCEKFIESRGDWTDWVADHKEIVKKYGRWEMEVRKV